MAALKWEQLDINNIMLYYETSLIKHIHTYFINYILCNIKYLICNLNLGRIFDL